MATLTVGNILDRIVGNSATGIVGVIGNDSIQLRNYLATSFDHACFQLFDIHDWEFKHKSSTFNTVVALDNYDLSVSSPDIRSSQDVECIWDFTNGRFLHKVDLRDIRKHWPKQNTSDQPVYYAPWGETTIFVSDIPNGIYTINYLYICRYVPHTSESDDLQTTLGIPQYLHYLIERMVLAEAMLFEDDQRRQALLEEIGDLTTPETLIFNAVRSDMRNLESGARFKFWEEELRPIGLTFDDFLRRTWAQGGFF